MASKRKRGNTWHYRIKRTRLLGRELYFTFDDEVAGDNYVAKLEALLDKGVVPKELLEQPKELSLSALLENYKRNVTLADSEIVYVNLAIKDWGDTRLTSIDYDWAEDKVAALKERKLAPVSIRRRVGSVARGIDWAIRKKYSEFLTENPLRLLPRGYSTYQDDEVVDVERDRRCAEDEEALIMNALADNREKRLMVVIALETAMRLSEIYTLQPSFVDFEKRTIFLPKHLTKTREARQVPMSSVLVKELAGFKGFGHVKKDANVTSKYSTFFQRLFKRLKIDDFNFHDFRHEATCRFYERTRLTDIQISKITGHRDLKSLRRYASLRGSDLVAHMW